MASKAFRGFVPFLDRVLVKKVEPVAKTASGLYIPDKAQQKVKTAEVMAHGAGLKDIPMNVAVGESVLLPEFGGTKLELDNEEFMIFRTADIVGKFES